MYERTKEILHGYGYERYEISNYAKEGKMCRHNIGYWKRVPYLGFGVGAASLWKEKRWSNIRDRRQYVALWKEHKPREASRMIRENMQMISVREAQEETFFLGLRMMEGVSESRFEDTFGCAIEDVYGKELKKLEADGLVQREGGKIFLTDRGIDISNTVMTWFLQDEEEEELIYLILAILCSAGVSIFMRASEKYCQGHYGILLMNYVVCVLAGLILTGRGLTQTDGKGMPVTIVFGVVTGLLYCGSFILLQWNVRKNGVILSSTFMKLGVIVPAVLAVVWFGERPGWNQGLGFYPCDYSDFDDPS